jgi:hypothetical protein
LASATYHANSFTPPASNAYLSELTIQNELKKPYRLSAQDTMSVDFTGRTFFLSYRFSNQIQTFFCYPVASSTFFHEKPGIISSVVCRPLPWLFFLPYSTMSLADIGQCFLQ